MKTWLRVGAFSARVPPVRHGSPAVTLGPVAQGVVTASEPLGIGQGP
ncbi:MAG: hypothetical protein HY748_10275 [Elusimicrobia bacterium]|nr:hypothetical protein [Elusimicrobiota bacterium]